MRYWQELTMEVADTDRFAISYRYQVSLMKHVCFAQSVPNHSQSKFRSVNGEFTDI